MHIADGVDVNERAHTGDQQHHRHRQRIHPHLPGQVHIADGDPVRQQHCFGVEVVSGQSQHLQHGNHKRRGGRATGNNANPFFIQPAPKGCIDEQPGQWKGKN